MIIIAMKAYKTITVENREVGKKSFTKKLLKDKMVPGVIYLEQCKTVNVSMSQSQLLSIANDPSGKARLYEVDLNGKNMFCILKDIQFTQISDLPRSFDFKQVKSGDIVEVNIPIRILNKDICPGVKSGGDIYRLLYNVDLKCEVERIPYAIEIDVKDCQMGTKFFLSDIKLPEGCKMINNPILIRVAGKRVIKDLVDSNAGDASTTEDGVAGTSTDNTSQAKTANSDANAEANK